MENPGRRTRLGKSGEANRFRIRGAVERREERSSRAWRVRAYRHGGSPTSSISGRALKCQGSRTNSRCARSAACASSAATSRTALAMICSLYGPTYAPVVLRPDSLFEPEPVVVRSSDADVALIDRDRDEPVNCTNRTKEAATCTGSVCHPCLVVRQKDESDAVN